ncbi:MAG: glucosaminidase domain-containing protein [Gammaproteobacteria bacterium]|nr:glucosaminidase domain-containing protein [Gammaproteobacteria bacterium]
MDGLNFRISFIFALIIILLIVTGCGTSGPAGALQPCYNTKTECVEELPEFAEIKDVNEKKTTFFNLLHPMVNDANRKVLIQRSKALELFKLPVAELEEEDREWLLEISEAFNLEVDDIQAVYQSKEVLLKRLDVVPPSLALAQAANESGWGSSRFAREANNLYGQWCFTEGCGFIPKNRKDGLKHEVRKFDSVNESVFSYVRNINKHQAYQQLRTYRATLRQSKGQFSGSELAQGLSNYSERGEEYIKEIRSMIRTNKLSRFDSEFWNN